MTRKSRAWNKYYKRIAIACWNSWGFCNERFNYCMAMDCDILGVTELHGVQNKKSWRCKRWIASEDAGVDDEGNQLDSASGVAIMLSKRFSELVLAQGAVGSRIVFVLNSFFSVDKH